MGTLAAQVKHVAFYLGEIRQALCVVRGGVRLWTLHGAGTQQACAASAAAPIVSSTGFHDPPVGGQAPWSSPPRGMRRYAPQPRGARRQRPLRSGAWTRVPDACFRSSPNATRSARRTLPRSSVSPIAPHASCSLAGSPTAGCWWRTLHGAGAGMRCRRVIGGLSAVYRRTGICNSHFADSGWRLCRPCDSCPDRHLQYRIADILGLRGALGGPVGSPSRPVDRSSA